MGSNRGENMDFCQVVPSLVYFTLYLTRSHIDSTSRHFAVGLCIPVHNTSIYFTKSASIRYLMLGFGCFAEYIVFIILRNFVDSIKIRIYLNIINLSLLFISRIIFLAILYFSSQLAYHVYIILSIDSFFGGCSMSILAIAPEHSVGMLLSSNICRIVVPMFQFFIDLFFYSQTLLMLKIQCWISVTITFTVLCLWIYYSQIYSCNFTSGNNKENTLSNQETNIASFSETLEKAFSPFLMYPAASFFKEFLYPGTLPYAVLNRDKCHLINLFASIIHPVGPLTLFALEKTDNFKEWSSVFDTFWVLVIPICLLTVYTFLSIHTRIPSATVIRNSKPIVMSMTLSLIIYYSFLYTLSYSGVAKVVKTGFNGHNKTGHNAVITFNVTLSYFFRFFFSKLSVGYSNTRVGLGYHLPKFRPNHKMSNHNTFWFIFRKTFRTAIEDSCNDFKMNIRDYL